MKTIQILLVLALFSCNKEVNNTPPVTNNQDCKCGTIAQEDNYNSVTGNVITIYDIYRVTNDCTGNLSSWIYTDVQTQFGYSKIGSFYCHTTDW